MAIDKLHFLSFIEISPAASCAALC